MKRRVIGLLMVAALLLSLAACGKQNAEEATGGSAVEPDTTYTGTISSISTQSITLSTDGGELTIALTENTLISRDFGMGGQQPGDMGQMPSDMGEAPEDMGQMPSNMGEVPEGMGQMPSDMGQMPEAMEQEANGMSELPTGGEAASGMAELPEGMDNADIPQQPGGAAEQGGTPPEIPEGDAEQGGITAMEPMNAQSLTVADLSIGDTVTVITDENGAAASITVSGGDMGEMQQPGGMGQMPGGMASGVDSYDAATEFTADASESGTDYTSTGTDENALHVYEGAAVTISDSTITRQSDDSTGGDNSSFYGIGAATLVTDGTLTIADSTIQSDAAGGTGVFAYADGTAYVMDTVINTAQDTSGGIHVAGGGTLYAWGLTVETNGESAAAIRSDRGSGTMVVDGGTYISNGVGSPAVYSAADITVNNATLTATGSEAICIEGLNTIRLFDCDLSGDMEDLDQNDCTWNVILYQSMSGDSEIGNSTFEMVGGSLSAGNGGMFYTTNTESTFLISGVDITYAEDSEFFLKCTGNANQRGWGTTGSNGADCHFTAVGQAMQGNVIWDTISQLDLYILEGSSLSGAVINDETHAGSGGSGYAALYIDASSTWVVTGDSTLTSLYCAGTIVDAEGNTVTVTGTDGTVYVQGDSRYTVTVASYDSNVDISAASAVESFADFAVAKP